MKPININRRALSELVWNQFEYRTDGLSSELLEKLEALRKQADYNTGSLSLRDIMDLQRIVKHFQPFVVAEVGTFIGRSTAAMASMMAGGFIHTCDVSNDIELPELNPDVQVTQYQKMTSRQMFDTLLGHKIKVDLFYIDGRLSVEDLPLVQKLMHDRTVFVLDDFEGVEKGVANAMLLLQAFKSAFYVLVYPRRDGKTAILLPRTLLEFTAQ